MAGGGWTYEGPTANDWFKVGFTGESVEIKAPDRSKENNKGTQFHFKLRGAAAGDPHRDDPEGRTSRGGYGGACEGSYTFDSKSTFFVYVGGKGGEG